MSIEYQAMNIEYQAIIGKADIRIGNPRDMILEKQDSDEAHIRECGAEHGRVLATNDTHLEKFGEFSGGSLINLLITISFRDCAAVRKFENLVGNEGYLVKDCDIKFREGAQAA